MSFPQESPMLEITWGFMRMSQHLQLIKQSWQPRDPSAYVRIIIIRQSNVGLKVV